MQDRPTPSELLNAVERLLDDEVLAATSGPLRHRVRVAANLCRIVEREVVLGTEQEASEVALLGELLGEVDRTGQSANLNARLVERLRGDITSDFEGKAREVVLEIVRGKLAIAKPGYDDYDFNADFSGDFKQELAE